MKYRPEIDGLRSLAILPVVAFHSGITTLSGGFTGVDVFFVISGFLITGIILSEIDAPGTNGGFSILNFYKRRILRILPALSLVLAATAVAAYALMLPNEFLATGRGIVATALFLSNIYFWRQSGYFDGASELKPLLHTWSLAVEEQFYLVFPLVLIGVARWLGGRFVLWISAMVLASFALSVVGLRTSPSTTFYLLPTRVWELGIGALIAAGGAPRLAAARNRDIAAWIGVALVAYGVLGLSEADPFPGWNALYPCLGASLIIAYGAGTGVGQLLSRAGPVYVGRISYSLYLWHWPVIVFYRMLHGRELTPTGTATVIALSFALAVLSYHFVETPFRAKHFRALPAPRVLWAGAASILACLAVGGAIAGTGGAWRSYPDEVLRVAAYTGYTETPEYVYQFGKGDGCSASGYGGGDGPTYNREKCLATLPDRKNYLVIGDSHAGAVWRAISLAFPRGNFIKASVSGCRPLLDAEGEAPCRETFNYIYREFLPKNRLDGVILVGRWRATDFPKVAPTLAHLKKYADNVVVFGPTVEYRGEFPLLLASEKLNGTEGIIEAALDPSKKGLSDELGRIVTAENVGGKVEYVAIYDVICGKDGCLKTAANGVPMQFDYGHLTLEGSELVINRVRDQLHLGG